MSIRLGKCNNLEFCRTAVTQRVAEIAAEEPFICPECSADLVSVGIKRERGTNKSGLIALQAGVVVAGAGIIGWKVLMAPPSHALPELHAPRATAAEMALAANPDAPVDTVAPAEPVVAPVSLAAAAPLPPPKILLRLAGSDVIASHMARRLAAGYLALIGDTDIQVVPGADAATVQIAGMQAGQREAVEITASTSAAGLAALKSGRADVALSTRQINDVEKQGFATPGDMTASASEHVVGVEAVAVIVNPANPLASVSKDQLRGILNGDFTDWSQLGQPKRPLHLYLRDAGQDQTDSPAAVIGSQSKAAIPMGTPAELVEAVKRDAGSIGLVDVADAQGGRIVPVSDAVNHAVAPADIAVASEEYPLTRRLYLYNGQASAGSFARRFADYAASAAGQEVVGATGFTPLSVKLAKPAVQAAPAAPNDKLAALVGNATRLSTTFRFNAGSTALDTRALRDIDRLTAFVRNQGLEGKPIILVGFADNVGNEAGNAAVAQRRAEAVAAALGHAGLAPVRTQSFGAGYPVADNATPEGREKNRRVEAYVMR